MQDVPVTITNAGTGPFGIQGNEWDWYLYVKDGATPSVTEMELANRVGKLADTMREFERTDVALALMKDLRQTASATLVQPINVDLKKYVTEIDDLEKAFFRRVVTPLHKKRLARPSIMTLLAFAVSIYLAFLFPVWDAARPGTDLSWGDTIGFVVAGALLGRLLTFAAAFGESITSLEQFHIVEANKNTVLLSVFFDMVVGAAAALAFISGLLIVAIGATQDDPTAGISSLTISENGLNAVVFGIIVGFAKAQFLKKFSDVSSEAME